MSNTSSRKIRIAMYWKVTLACLVLLLVAVVTVPWHIKWWPSGFMRSHVNLWLHEDAIKEILELAEETPYDRIFWVDAISRDDYSRPATILVDVFNETRTSFVQVEEPDISSLISVAQQAQIFAFSMIKIQGTWAYEGYSDAWGYSDGSQLTVMTHYQYDSPGRGERCSKSLIESSDDGYCYTTVFGDWIMQKTWWRLYID